jgi:hypothetical protein
VQKRERLGLPEGETDPDLDKFDESEWQIEEEPEALVQARKKLDEFVTADQNGTANPSATRLLVADPCS